ncbi:MAG: hypothetical protein ABL958_09360 [Bdellovibrionia bacterium]
MKTWMLIGLALSASQASANNLHLIDADAKTGFAIYRTGKPSSTDMKELCKLGVTEIAVLSGDAQKVEIKNQVACPTLKVVYNVEQSAKIPLTEKFISDFDKWVLDSHALGKKIAFRCSCGCHRTGRLAAYYQMKYQGYSVAAALKAMNEYGKFMWLHPELKPQVYALNDFIQGKTCSTNKKYCVLK